MKCFKCNREIPDKSKFCPYCGEGVQDNIKEENNTVGTSLTSIVSTYNGATTSSKKKTPIVCKELVAIIATSIAVILLLIFMSNNAKNMKSASDNNAEASENSVNVLEDNGNTDDKGNTSTASGSGSGEVAEDVNEDEINIEDNTDNTENGNSLDDQFKKDCMPSEYLPYGVNTGNVAADNIAVKQGDWVYFICEGGIYKQNSKGETYIILEEGSMWIHPTNLNICGDYLYFRHEERDTYVNTIDRIRTDGKERETVISDGDIVRGEFSFVCDYEDQLIVCSEKHVKDGYSEDGNDYIASYKRYSLDDESINLEYTPEDYNGRPISYIKIIGMSGGYVYAFENYHNKGGTSKVIAKIEPKSFTIERVEFEQNVSSGVVFNGDSLFVTDDTSHYTLHMVDLNSMSVLYDVTYLNGEKPVACYKDNGDNYVIFSDMWMANVDRFPDNAGKSLGDGSFTNASIIDKSIYYSIKDDYGWSQMYRIGIYNDVNEAVFIQEVTNKLEQ